MVDGLSLNLQLLQNISEVTGTKNNNTVQNSEPQIYAKDGEPNYNEEMDYDKDGVVTMEEYQKYCKENNIEMEETVQSVQNMAGSAIQKQVAEQKSSIDYNEYMKFCEDNVVENAKPDVSTVVSHNTNKESGLEIRNLGKAFTNYSNNQIKLPQAQIEKNA